MAFFNKFNLSEFHAPRPKRNSREALKQRFKLQRIHLERGLKILPNIFTLGNAFFGFCSVIFTVYGDLVAAAYFILIGALMDSLDGRIARFARVTSEFGMQLDSLCDAITFGLAPAVLVYVWQLKKLGLAGLITAALFLMAGLLRLARFNITSSQQSTMFIGIPIPMGGCFLAALFLNTRFLFFKPFQVILLMLLVLIVAGLMISTLRFPSFKQLSGTTYKLIALGGIAIVITMGFTRVLLLLFICYFMLSLGQALISKISNKKS